MSPRTGRILNENDEVLNEADALRKYSDSTVARTTVGLDFIAVQDGRAYTGAAYSALTAGQTVKTVMVTPDDKDIIFLPIHIQGALGALSVILYQGSSNITGGTTIAPQNRNLNSTNVSGATITVGATVGTNGTAVGAFYVLQSAVPSEVLPSALPIILKRDTAYTIAVTNTALSGESPTANAFVAEFTYIEY